MALKFPDKDPEAVKDYAINWTAMLAADEIINDSAWTVDPTGEITIGASAILDGVCTVWLSGGTDGFTYALKNHITTDRGMEDERTVSIKAKHQ